MYWDDEPPEDVPEWETQPDSVLPLQWCTWSASWCWQGMQHAPRRLEELFDEDGKVWMHLS